MLRDDPDVVVEEGMREPRDPDSLDPEPRGGARDNEHEPHSVARSGLVSTLSNWSRCAGLSGQRGTRGCITVL